MKKVFLIVSLMISLVGYSQIAKVAPSPISTSVDEYAIFVPNSFTPNEDGLNDIFSPSVIGYQTFEMTIFDRWSETLYKTNDLSKGWDGKYKGQSCKENTYVWEIATIDIYGVKHYYIGYLTIIK